MHAHQVVWQNIEKMRQHTAMNNVWGPALDKLRLDQTLLQINARNSITELPQLENL